MKHLIMATMTFIFLAVFAVPAVANQSREYMEDYAERVAYEFDLSPELVKVVIDTESSWNPNCKSSAGAIGLMQLMPGTGKWCCEQLGIPYEPYDWQTNITMGCYYLSYLRDEYSKADMDCGDLLSTVLIAYNRGISGANKYIAKHGLKNWYADTVIEKKIAYEMEMYSE